MFTPTRMAAGVAIIALAGSLAIISAPLAGPAEELAPAAITPSPSPEPDGLHVQGRMDFNNMSNPAPDMGETTEGPDGESSYRGAWFQTRWASNDPRFKGSGEYTANSNTYPLDSESDITIGWGTQSLVTAEGTWTSRPGSLGLLGDGESVIPIWFDGGGAYEGMSAFLLQEVHEGDRGGPFFTFEGWILPSDRHFEDAVWE